MSNNTTWKGLIDKPLDQFKIKEYHKVYRVDEQGISIKNGTIGYFKDPKIAAAFAHDKDKNYTKTRPVYLLTNEKEFYLLDEEDLCEDIKIFNDEEETLRLRNAAIKKLDQTERDLLNLHVAEE